MQKGGKTHFKNLFFASILRKKLMPNVYKKKSKKFPFDEKINYYLLSSLIFTLNIRIISMNFKMYA